MNQLLGMMTFSYVHFHEKRYVYETISLMSNPRINYKKSPIQKTHYLSKYISTKTLLSILTNLMKLGCPYNEKNGLK